MKERKQFLRKYGRCFTCLKKGHVARNSNSKINCNVCKDRHHTSICDGTRNSVKDNATRNSDEDDARYSKPMFHVGSALGVPLQTVQAIINGRKRLKVRVLFDSGGHRSFITSRAVELSEIEKIRNEWIKSVRLNRDAKWVR